MASAADTKLDTAKIDAAAEKAYAEAAARTEAAKVEAPKAVPSAVEAPKPAPALKAETIKRAAPAKAAPAPKAKKVSAKKAVKTATAKPAKAPAVAKKAAAKPAAKKTVKIAAKAAPRKVAAKVPTISKLKDTIMAKTQTTTADFTAKLNDTVADVQSRAKVAYEKGTAMVGDYTDFNKGNVQALVEAGKIFAAGVQDMGKAYVAEGKSAFETMTADVKELAAVKSPTDFFKLQGEILRRNFDAAVATGSKNSEAVLKLANDAFAPLSSRVSMAIEKVKKAA